MKKYIWLLLLLLVCGCSKQEKPKTYKELMQENDFVIVDVRTNEEYKESHVKDAINIPYDNIDDKIDITKDKLIFVYCKSGKRSSIAYESFKSLGYDVYDLGAYESIDLEKVQEEGTNE